MVWVFSVSNSQVYGKAGITGQFIVSFGPIGVIGSEFGLFWIFIPCVKVF